MQDNRFDAGGILRNYITKLGTERARSSSNIVGRRLYLRRTDLDVLDQHSLVRRISSELPGDAGGSPTVSTSSDINTELEQRLRDLRAAKRLRRAGYVSRAYGGAAVWVVTRGGGDPSVALDLKSVERVENLVVINRFELTPQFGGDQNTAYSLYENDPRKVNYLEPSAYLYTPAQGGTPIVIHASRLIRFYGIEVPEHLRADYDGWGAPVIEGSYRTFGQLYMAFEGGAELAYEAGHMVYRLDNLQQILSGSRRDDLSEWMDLQSEARSVLRGTVLGAGQDADRMEMRAGGWSDIVDRLLQLWASENDMPLTKLYGTAPGGLSTDDASAHRNWGARVADYQTDVLIPAYEQLLHIICHGRREPTRGELPERIEVSLPPYDVPTQEEEAGIANTWADVVSKMVSMGVIDIDEARETMRGVEGLQLIEEEETPASSELMAMLQGMGEQEGAPAPAEDPPKDAEHAPLNAAQALAMKDIIASVYLGELPRESAIQMLAFVFNVPLDRARDIVGAGDSSATPGAELELAAKAKEAGVGEPSVTREAVAADGFFTGASLVAKADDDRPTPLNHSEEPPKGARDAAQDALDAREEKPESERAMTDTGLARARDLSNGRPVTLRTMRTMWAWFERHEVDKEGETWGEKGKGWQAWHGWGGDAARSWVTERLKRHGHLVRRDGEWGLVPIAELRGDATRIDPYEGSDDPELPGPVAALPQAQRAQWVAVFNEVYEETSDDAESFAAAYAAVMKVGR